MTWAYPSTNCIKTLVCTPDRGGTILIDSLWRIAKRVIRTPFVFAVLGRPTVSVDLDGHTSNNPPSNAERKFAMQEMKIVLSHLF
jgi:hypothetical protein